MQVDPKLLLGYSNDLEVLYVEDDLELQTATAKLLKHFFQTVDCADNGWEGLKYYQEKMRTSKPYDLVLTDINMPQMNGIEMSNLILDIMPEQKIAIISASNEVDYLQSAIELGISGYITKPIEDNQLFRQLLCMCCAIQDKKRYRKYVTHITQQNKVFREQAQSKRIETVQEEFLRNISHEIKTPINAILAISEIIGNHIDENDHSMQQFLKIIEDNSTILNDLISRILQLSLLRTGNYQLIKEHHVLDQFLERMISDYGTKSESMGITLNHELISIPNVPIGCDLTVIKTVISELLDNALKFNDRGGRITLSMTYDKQIHTLMIDVKDNGIGIEPEEHEKIFDIFYQTDKSITRKVDGNGIGLALVKYMVELNGGHIKLESKSGEGAFFHVTLPVE